MKRTIYMAPMEGVTDSIFRNVFKKYYGGVDKYFTPFLSPNDTRKFTTKEWREINPEQNDINDVIPQLLCNKADHFLWACKEIAPLGYKEINFNLGCPSGTVVAKRKGSGLLYFPEELDKCLYEIFDGVSAIDSNLKISIKTRLGKVDPEEFYEILDIYNKYPISELTIHPRIQSDFYKERVRPEYFDYASKNTDIPLVYNGDLNTTDDIMACFKEYPGINAVMLGRGLVTNPPLVLDSEESQFDYKLFRQFHDELVDQYSSILSGDTPLLHRMKEFWSFWAKQFPDKEKEIKKLRKAKHLTDYNSACNTIF